MKRLLVCSLVVLLGCGSLKPALRDPSLGAKTAPQGVCDSYDSAHATWGGVAAGAGLMAGAGGLSSISTDDKDVKLGLALGSVVAGAVAAMSAYLSAHNARNFTNQCTESVPTSK